MCFGATRPTADVAGALVANFSVCSLGFSPRKICCGHDAGERGVVASPRPVVRGCSGPRRPATYHHNRHDIPGITVLSAARIIMPFSEALKLEVKRMAAFRCCRCHEIGIDIHHIIPQAAGGSDDIDNAAPLCQNCHSRFGANPEKRKEIRQMRDWWYEVVIEKYGDQSQFEKLNETILKAQQLSKADLDEVRKEVIDEVRALRRIQEEALERIKYVSISGLSSTANSAVSATSVMVRTDLGFLDDKKS